MRRSLAIALVAALALGGVAWFLSAPDTAPTPPATPPAPEVERSAPAPRAARLRELKEAWQAGRAPEQAGPDEEDSEVWMDFFESVLEPAMSTGSPSGGSIDHLFATTEARNEAIWGHSCYDVARGDPRHPAWQAFLRWVRGEDSLEEVQAACTRRLPGR